MGTQYKASYKSRIIRDLVREKLVDSGAVSFQLSSPKLLGSRLETPVVIDNQKFQSTPVEWRDVIDALLCTLKDEAVNADVIAGIDVSSSMLAQAVAYRLGLPAVTVYLRGGPDRARIDGEAVAGRRVVIIEDHVSTGHCAAWSASLRGAGATVEDIVTVTSFDLEVMKKRMTEDALTVHEVIDFAEVIETAVKKNIISAEEKKHVVQWLMAPTFKA